MTETINCTNTSFSMIAFFDENDNELMELNRTSSVNDYTMRVPCIGEHIILSSYEHDHTNDEKAIFRNKINDLFVNDNHSYLVVITIK